MMAHARRRPMFADVDNGSKNSWHLCGKRERILLITLNGDVENGRSERRGRQTETYDLILSTSAARP